MKANTYVVKPFGISEVKVIALKGDPGTPTQEQVNTAVDEYMTEHPEAQIPDGSITEQKLSSDVVATLNDVDNKADKVGSYPDLIAGTADNLLSSSYQTDRTPYILRRTPYGVRERGSIVGGSIVWNQLAKPANDWSPNWGSGTYVAGDNEITITNAPSGFYSFRGATALTMSNHVMLATCLVKVTNGEAGVYLMNGQAATFNKTSSSSYVLVASMAKETRDGQNYNYNLQLRTSTACESVSFKCPMFFDLTLMFGSTIADYIYAQEQATAGAGVALAKKWAGIKGYVPYDAGTLKSVSNVSAHKMTGFNQWDEEWEVGTFDTTTGANLYAKGQIRSKNIIKILPNTTYYWFSPVYNWTILYDADGNVIPTPNVSDTGSDARSGNSFSIASKHTFTTPANAYGMRFYTGTYKGEYKNDICLNISSDKNGTYEPYAAHTYPLDSSLTLRGLPKLDGDNLYYDGDIYRPSGEGTRRYREVTLTKDMTYVWTDNIKQASIADIIASAPASYTASSVRLISNKLKPVSNDKRTENIGDYVALISSGSGIALSTPAQSLAEFMTWIASNPVTVVYELATPQPFTAEPYTELQICDPNGTEEWVGASMPVGHETKYYEDLKGKIEDIPDAPSTNGTYVLKATVSASGVTYAWIAG